MQIFSSISQFFLVFGSFHPFIHPFLWWAGSVLVKRMKETRTKEFTESRSIRKSRVSKKKILDFEKKKRDWRKETRKEKRDREWNDNLVTSLNCIYIPMTTHKITSENSLWVCGCECVREKKRQSWYIKGEMLQSFTLLYLMMIGRFLPEKKTLIKSYSLPSSSMAIYRKLK